MPSIRQSIRSSTASKRPTSAIADGQIALNTASGTPGMFFKDSAGNIVKTGPAHYGATAPNSSPAVGGSTGNSIGEAWLDVSLTPAGWKIWNGSAWVNATPLSSDTVQGLVELATNAETQAGVDAARAVTAASLQSKVSDSISTTSASGIASSTAVKTAYDLANAALPKSGGIVTGNLEIGSTGSFTFEGATADGFETTLAVVDPTTDRTITFPNITGTVVTTGDTGTVTSTMILDGTILNADINASAAIVDTKLATIATAGKVSNSATTAASANTASAIVARDASGNFTAGTITAALTGAASSNVLKAGDTMTGALVVPVGSVAAPSVSFTSDVDTGIFSAGAGRFNVAVDGSVKLEMNTTSSRIVSSLIHLVDGNNYITFIPGSPLTVDNYNTSTGLWNGYQVRANNHIFSTTTSGGVGTTFDRLTIANDGTVNIPGTLTKNGSNVVTVGDTGTVTSTMLLNGTIVNADISDTAAIAGTKISTNFGSQNITTSGNIVTSGNITAASYIAPSGTATAPSVQVGSGVFYPPGIYSPGVDQLAIATSGVTRLLSDGNGCITVGTSTGSTKSIWSTGFPPGSGVTGSGINTQVDVPNVGFLCQPPTVYSASPAGQSYYPAIFAGALTSDSAITSILYGISVRNNTAATTSGASVTGIGIDNRVLRSDSITNNASPGIMSGIQNIVTVASGVATTSTITRATGQNNNVFIYGGSVITAVTGYATTLFIATTSGSTSSAPTCYAYDATQTVGASSGAGTGVATNVSGYRSKLTVNATGQVTNYYGVLLSAPTVNGTLTNRYSVYSEDASSPMYHAGSIGVGTPAPAYQLQLSTDSAGKPSTNTWTVVSDERIKDDIELANLDLCYEAVKNIPLKRFKWKDEVYSSEQVSDRRKLGWIAQDVETVFPKAVRIKEFKYNQAFEDVIIPAIEPELDDEGNVIVEGEPERIEQKLISEDVIEDCRDLNVDQLYAAMYGTIQKLISKVETLETMVAILEGNAT